MLGLTKYRILNFAKQPFYIFISIFANYFYRAMCNLPNPVYYAYVFANTSLILSYYFARFLFILNFYNQLTLTDYTVFYLLSILSMVFYLLRVLFRLGCMIDQNPHVVLTLERLVQGSAGFFGNLGRRVSGQMPLSPGPSGVDKNFALGVGTFFATSVAATGAVYMCYESYQMRQISLRSLNVAEASAKAAQESAKAAQESAQADTASAKAIQQKSDIKAVKHGLMSTEEYTKKYSK